MATLLLPSTLDAATLPVMIASLDRLVYPKPTNGFTARMAVLLALSGLSMILALLYLLLHYRSTAERPRSRCLWFVRLVDRPSGRFIVVNPRMAWVGTVFFYGCFELLVICTFWRVYQLGHGQRLWIGVRSFTALVMFSCGWIIAWAGLTAFLVAVDSERQFLSARTANVLFVGGGLVIIVVMVALATVTTILTERFWDRYLDLRAALVVLMQTLNGRVPTLLDFLPLQTPAAAFVAAADAARIASIVQFSILTLFPLAILMVNLGGLALCSRMKRQLKESVSLVVVTNPGPAHDLAATPAGSSEADLAAPEGPLPAPSSPSPAPEARSTGEGTHIQKPRARPDGCELPYLARQRENGGGSAARAQARRILVLKKAMCDLQTTAWHVALVSSCMAVTAIWLAYCSATDKMTMGTWGYIEGTVMPAQWLYLVVIDCCLVYLLVNQLRSRARIFDLETLVEADAGAATPRGHVSYLSRSPAPRPSTAKPGPGSTEDDHGVKLELAEGSEKPSPLAGEAADTAMPAPLLRDGGPRPVPRAKSWASFASRESAEGGSAGGGGPWRTSWLARGPSLPPRIPSTASSILVTVETSQVCEDGSSAPWDPERQGFVPEEDVPRGS